MVSQSKIFLNFKWNHSGSYVVKRVVSYRVMGCLTSHPLTNLILLVFEERAWE